MSEKPFLTLQPSETAVLHAASRIYAALLTSEHGRGADAAQLFDRAVEEAIRMAELCDRKVRSDNELG